MSDDQKPNAKQPVPVKSFTEPKSAAAEKAHNEISQRVAAFKRGEYRKAP
jgi:hypothetical protein